jgi:hypothetical protein
MNYNKLATLASIAIVALTGCKPNLKSEPQTSGDANFAHVVTIGDNFMAGFSNGVLNKSNQEHSVAFFVGNQLSSVTGAVFVQPLMPAGSGAGPNAKPWESDFVSNYRLGYRTFTCDTSKTLSPLKDFKSYAEVSNYFTAFTSPVNDYSAPFATSSDYANGVGNNLFMNRFAVPGAMLLDKIIADKPTFATVWLGMEDVYKYIRVGAATGAATTPGVFQANLEKIVSTLAASGTKGAIANIPSFEVFPYYSYFSPFRAVLDTAKVRALNDAQISLDGDGKPIPGGQFNWKEGVNSFIISPSYVFNPDFNYRHMGEGEYITLSLNSDSVKCAKVGTLTDMPNRYVLDSLEVSNINVLISQYNTIIKTVADKHNWALVDMNNYFNSVKKGVKNAGVDYSMAFLSSNFIGLDAFHPTQKGYEMISNEFINAINTKYNAKVWPVVCTSCEAIKFP